MPLPRELQTPQTVQAKWTFAAGLLIGKPVTIAISPRISDQTLLILDGATGNVQTNLEFKGAGTTAGFLYGVAFGPNKGMWLTSASGNDWVGVEDKLIELGANGALRAKLDTTNSATATALYVYHNGSLKQVKSINVAVLADLVGKDVLYV